MATVLLLLAATGGLYAASRPSQAPAVTAGQPSPSYYESPYYTADDLVRFSHAPGFYEKSFGLSMTLAEGLEEAEGYHIRYTLDGNLPALSRAEVYRAPFLVGHEAQTDKEVRCTVVRAQAFRGDRPCGRVVTASYFFAEEEARSQLMFISVVSDEKSLYDYETGILVGGKIKDAYVAANPGVNYVAGMPANFSQRGNAWERPAHVEFFEDGVLAEAQNMGLRVFGGASRWMDYKPLRVFSRREYETLTGKFHYDFFKGRAVSVVDNRRINSFDILSFRYGSGDFYQTRMRDETMACIASQLGDVATHRTRAAVLFLNGQYYTVCQIHETYDRDYIQQTYSLPDDNVSILDGAEISQALDLGDPASVPMWHDMQAIARTSGPLTEEEIAYFEDRIDFDNLFQYYAAEIYFANLDWPSNNYKVWRYNADIVPGAPLSYTDGRFRFMLYDLEFGLGMHYAYDSDFLGMIVNGPKLAHVDFDANILFPKLMRTPKFRAMFLTRFYDYLNTVFSEEHVVSVINFKQLEIAPEMPYMLGISGLGTLERWDSFCQHMRNFAANRKTHLYAQMKTHLGAQKPYELTVTVGEGGSVQLNTLTLRNETEWKGTYYTPVLCTLNAVADKGYRLAYWTVNGAKSEVPALYLDQDATVEAVFVPDESAPASLCINEIYADGRDGNWIELYNPTSKPVYLGNYSLSDNGENPLKYVFGSQVYVPAKGHLTVWCDRKDAQAHGGISCGFSLADGETLYLCRDSVVVDSLPIPRMTEGEAYGRYPDGQEPMYLQVPTPTAANVKGTLGATAQPYMYNRLLINGSLLEEGVLVRDGQWLVPLTSVGKALGFTVEEDETGGNFRIRGQGYAFTAGSTAVERRDYTMRDGKVSYRSRALTSSVAAERVNGKLYVPLHYFLILAEGHIYEQKELHSLVVSLT